MAFPFGVKVWWGGWVGSVTQGLDEKCRNPWLSPLNDCEIWFLLISKTSRSESHETRSLKLWWMEMTLWHETILFYTLKATEIGRTQPWHTRWLDDALTPPRLSCEVDTPALWLHREPTSASAGSQCYSPHWCPPGLWQGWLDGGYLVGGIRTRKITCVFIAIVFVGAF